MIVAVGERGSVESPISRRGGPRFIKVPCFRASSKAAMRADVYHRPVIPVTLCLMFGIVIGSEFPGGEVIALALVLASGAMILRCLIRQLPAAISPLLLFAALGYLSLQPWVHPRFSEEHVSRFLDTGPWEVTGVVDARPLEYESRTQFLLQIEGLKGDRESHRVTGLLRVTAAGEVPDVNQGDRLSLHGRIRRIRNFNNPGGFDFKRSMSFRGVWASIYVEAGRMAVLQKGVQPGFFATVDRARSAIADSIERAGLGPEAPLLKALIMGDQSGIAPGVREAFARTGTSHILAISGLHVAIVASAFFLIFRWLLSWIPLALQHAWVRKGAALLTLIPVCLYALVAGFSPSTQRALIMVTTFLLALLVEREIDLMNTLAVAALGILLVQPPSLFSISFQLSFAAVFFIVYGLERFHPELRTVAAGEPGKPARIRHSLMLFFSVSLLATWGTLPIGMFYFNRVSYIGLPANAVAVPLIGYAAVAGGLIGTLLLPLSAPAALMCLRVSGFILSKAVDLIEWMAELPFAADRTMTPSLFEIALFYLISWTLFYLVTIRRQSACQVSGADGSLASCRASAGGGRIRAFPRRLAAFVDRVSTRKAAAALLVLGLVFGAADAGYWLYQRFGRNDLRMTLLDVGQGSAALLEFPGGYTVLVDGGGFSDPAAFDVGARVVAPYLWRNKIASVDTLILSHPNSDHMNGLVFIADNFNVRSLWTNGESRPMPGFTSLMRTAAERGIGAPHYADIPRHTAINDAKLEVLHPPLDFLKRKNEHRWRRDENNNSLVVRVSYGEVSILLPGDIMQPAERELVGMAGDKLKSTVLVAPHHGSRTSSSEEFLAAVAPQAVVISCADRPGSGIPHPQILRRYEDHGAIIYRTDRNGAIRFITDGQRFSIQPVFITKD